MKLNAIIPETNKALFDKYSDEIDKEIKKQSVKWTLDSFSHTEYADIAQNIRLHIYAKIHLYDDAKSHGKISNWLKILISNQLINTGRRLWGNIKRPCSDCQYFRGESVCERYQVVSNECELYRIWSARKKNAHDVKLPLPLENHIDEVYDKPEERMDIEGAITKVHDKMKVILKPSDYEIYDLVYIQHKTDSEAAEILGYKTIEDNKYIAYRAIQNTKKRIVKKAKEMVWKGEIDIFS